MTPGPSPTPPVSTAVACCAPDRGRHESHQAGGQEPLRTRAAGPRTLVVVPGGTFRMGSANADDFADDGEGPVREVEVSAFAIDAVAVSNDRFAEFVDATGHLTDAERFGWSFVFEGHLPASAQLSVVGADMPGASWWRGVRGADWRHPAGPGSSLNDLGNHPAVHVSHRDATAFAAWAEGRLPTEAEWEKAARGGLDQARYPWGDELLPDGHHRANIWQGSFPHDNTRADGYDSTAPVESYQPNAFGLHNMAGNVWEWTADWFSPDWHRPASDATRRNPRGPGAGPGRVLKGGSFLCHGSYCNRYRVAARTYATADSSLSHTGFRLAADV